MLLRLVVVSEGLYIIGGGGGRQVQKDWKRRKNSQLREIFDRRNSGNREIKK